MGETQHSVQKQARDAADQAELLVSAEKTANEQLARELEEERAAALLNKQQEEKARAEAEELRKASLIAAETEKRLAESKAELEKQLEEVRGQVVAAEQVTLEQFQRLERCTCQTLGADFDRQLLSLRAELEAEQAKAVEELHASYKDKIAKLEDFIKRLTGDDLQEGGTGLSSRNKFRHLDKLPSLTEVSSIEGSGQGELSDRLLSEGLQNQLGLVPRLQGLPKLNIPKAEERDAKLFLTDRIDKLEDELKAKNEKLQQIIELDEHEKAELMAKIEGLNIELADEKETVRQLRKQLEDDREMFLKRINELSDEINRHKDQILDKMADIKSLKQMRDEELVGFTMSVAEFNRQLEEERVLFNQRLQELNNEKRKQLDLLTAKIQELHAQQEKEKAQLVKDIAEDNQAKSFLEHEFEEKDQAMKKLIDEYTREVQRLKLENSELRTEYEEAKKSIREYMSQIDPDEDSRDMMDESLTNAFNKKKKFQHNKTMMLEEEHLLKLPAKNSTLLRCFSNLNLGAEDLNSPISPIFLSPSMSRKPEMKREKGSEFSLQKMMDEDKSPIAESIVINQVLSQAGMSSKSNSFEQLENVRADRKESMEQNSSHDGSEEESDDASERGPVQIDAKRLFKAGRRINLLPVQKRLYKQKIPEISNVKDAKERIKQVCDHHIIHLSRGSHLFNKMVTTSSTWLVRASASMAVPT